jgi:flagellum-specific peptidoglycan hydrolase FlgJ/LysM repeat protein
MNVKAMTVKANLFIYILVLAVLVSCRVSKPAATVPVSVSGTASDYINLYGYLAVSEMRRTGVPASITLAQGMLESDYGRSSLARSGNNHFGIKCHNDWTGQTITQHDDKRNECFRKYRRPEDSFYDHSDFLKSGSRYRSLFDLDPMDYKAWARGLKSSGYATNPDYANLLIRKIEENKLYELDKGCKTAYIKPQPQTSVKETPAAAPAKTTGTTSNQAPRTQEGTITFGDVMARAPRIMENNRIQYIIVKDGETRKKLENEFQLLNWELPRYNELNDDFTPVAGQMLYLEPKRDKAETGIEYHTAAEGETMYMISQKYGIKLKKLLEMNRMAEGSDPVAGQKIWLQATKPAN